VVVGFGVGWGGVGVGWGGIGQKHLKRGAINHSSPSLSESCRNTSIISVRLPVLGWPQRDLTLKDFFPPSPATPSHYGHVFGAMLQTSPQLLHALQVGGWGVGVGGCQEGEGGGSRGNGWAEC
jgi:hypothetical protein